jgi:hypothetical protein
MRLRRSDLRASSVLGAKIMGLAPAGNGCPPADERPSGVYLRGVADGQRARTLGTPLDAYLQVGMDDYAKGFRRGFFGRERIEDPRTG